MSVTVVRNSNIIKNTIWASGAATRPLLGHPETFQIPQRRKAFNTTTVFGRGKVDYETNCAAYHRRTEL
jgi:hypothetical protein